ncbi:Fe-S-containing protein [Deferrisoma palaeochoriense]
MSQNTNRPEDKLAAKKAAVLGQEKPKRSKAPLLAMIACAVVVVGAGVAFWGLRGGPASEVAAVTAAHAGEIVLPADQFDDGKARFFQYEAGDGVTIKYFVLKSSDGVIRTAFDACDSCWPAGKGYRQDGDEMVCQNCRMRFPSVKVMEVKGGCNPAPLKREVRDGKVILRVADILEGRRYFQFGREG